VAVAPSLDTVGLAWRVGEARAVTAEYLPRIQGWLEDAGAVKVACDVKSALLALGRLGIEARGFDHDVMLYAFLLDAEPSGCSLEEAGAAAASMCNWGPRRTTCRHHSGAMETTGAGGGGARHGEALPRNRAAAGAGAGAHGADGGAHRHRELRPPRGSRWKARSRG